MELYEKFLTEEVNEKGQLTGVKWHVPETYNFGFDIVDWYGTNSPNKKAMIWVSSNLESRIFTFGEIMKSSNQAANYFRSLGIKKGDKILLILRRHWEFWVIIVALHKIGAIVIPATDQLKAKDIEYRFNAANVKAIVCTATGNVLKEAEAALKNCSQVEIKIVANGSAEGWHNYTEELKPFSDIYLRPLDDSAPTRDEIMLMYFTSGTTAYPKIAAHEHTYSLAHFVTAKWWHNVKPESLHFTVAETGWGKAVWGKLYGQWLCGSCVFTYDFDKFDQDRVLKMFGEYKITSFCAPPTIYRFMIHEDLKKYDLSSLEYLTTAGEALNPEVFKKLKEATGLSIMEGFGQTETTLSIANLLNTTPKMGSMGRPTPIYKLRLVDADGKDVTTGEAGEICIDISEGNPYGLFREYYNNKKETDVAMHDGLYHTGDVAWSDEDGYLYFVGRTDDIIKSSGYRIGPFEIESVIMEHPAVIECAVTGVPDEVRGQVVKATIVLKKGVAPTDELKVEIQQFVKHLTAPYKYPRIIDFVDELPKTISGKIRRTELRKSN